MPKVPSVGLAPPIWVKNEVFLYTNERAYMRYVSAKIAQYQLAKDVIQCADSADPSDLEYIHAMSESLCMRYINSRIDLYLNAHLEMREAAISAERFSSGSERFEKLGKLTLIVKFYRDTLGL